jgi:dipeptidyl-peptidase-4
MKICLNNFFNLNPDMKTLRLIVLLCLPFVQLSAQKKTFTMQEAVLGMSGQLAVKNLRQLQWMGSAEFFSQVVQNDSAKVILAQHPQTFATETLMSLEKMNPLLAGLGIPEMKSIPAVTFINQLSFYVFHDNRYIRFQAAGRDSARAEVMATLPAGAEHMQVHAASQQVAYTFEHNIYIAGPGGSKLQVTKDGTADIVYGGSVHRDEFGIDRGLFWSEDGKQLAFYRMDQQMVEAYPIPDWSVTPATVKNIRYPMAGRTSHEVTLGICTINGGETRYLQTGEPRDQYLTAVSWSPGGDFVYVGLLNREQNHLRLNKYDARNGLLVKTLFEEKNDRYVEPQHPLYFPGNDPTRFVWWSQRDGFMHLYLYDDGGQLIRQLTQGPWVVNELLGYNRKTQELIITSSESGAMEKKAYAVNLQTGARRMLTKAPGVHTVQLSAQGNFLIDVYSSRKVPRNIEITEISTGAEKRLLTASDPLREYQLATIENVTLYTSDSMPLYGKLMKPADFDPGRRYPVIVYLYNGPHVQLNRNSFPYSGNLWYDYLTQRGYLVFVMDGRGSANRGFAFESAVHRQLGTLEMEDQLRGVNWLKAQTFVDSTRMGVHGWSYGGFMTTSLMLRYPGVFKVGVAGGPVLDWSMYEVMYTERYMDTPKENPEGYAANVLFDKIKNLKGKLLMIHGTDDDVVVWQHSLKFVRKAVEDGVQMGYFVYPGHPHNVRGKDRVHLMQKVTDYFDAALKP